MTSNLGFLSTLVPTFMAAWFGARYWARLLPKGQLYSLLAFFCVLTGVILVYVTCIICLWQADLASHSTSDERTDYLGRGLGWSGLIMMMVIVSTNRFRLKFHPPGEIRPSDDVDEKPIDKWHFLITGLVGCIVSGFVELPSGWEYESSTACVYAGMVLIYGVGAGLAVTGLFLK
ncbi:hypothetical protein [Rhizobium sp. WYJ-E13]|uniref:hypothetical protein n=1 Tax=unclassified Rhizobium TaxID=2613769 RepID=UPI001C1EE589|nr:hypothetical protein [Rhizobium sp. WYJ-E13]QWW70165.1 hypothetical protein KQ933_10915 [Rhizobium sp. WYJ-E13]